MSFYMSMYIEGQQSGIKRLTGWKLPCSLVVIERQLNTAYQSPESMKEYQVFITQKLKDKAFRKRFIRFFHEADEQLLAVTRKIAYADLEKTSLPQLGRILKQFVSTFRFKFGIYGLPKFTDLAMRDILPKLLSVPLGDDDLLTLTRPTAHSEYTKERIDFLRLLQDIRTRGLATIFEKSFADISDTLGRYHPSLYGALDTHARMYAWVPVSHLVQPMTIENVVANIKEGLADETTAKELREREHESHEEAQERRASELRLTPADCEILSFIQALNEINESRKAAMSKAILWSYPLFVALAQRFGVNDISLRQLTADELLAAVNRGALSSADRKEMEERQAYFVCLLADETIIYASGEEARKRAEKELGVTDYSATKEVRGRVAFKGNVRGKVRLIMSEHQVAELLQGEILVTSMTDPDMVPAMKRAGAIVTDEGGITCHAAIVSRELQVPCIIATKIATKVFKNGDLVEVNATTGTIRMLR